MGEHSFVLLPDGAGREARPELTEHHEGQADRSRPAHESHGPCVSAARSAVTAGVERQPHFHTALSICVGSSGSARRLGFDRRLEQEVDVVELAGLLRSARAAAERLDRNIIEASLTAARPCAAGRDRRRSGCSLWCIGPLRSFAYASCIHCMPIVHARQSRAPRHVLAVTVADRCMLAQGQRSADGDQLTNLVEGLR